MRFIPRIRVLPGVYFNLNRKNPISVGHRNLLYTPGESGPRVRLGIPGTGLYYSMRPIDLRGDSAKETGAQDTPAEEPLAAGFFDGMDVPPEEQALVEGCRRLLAGDDEAALEPLRHAIHLPDGAYLAGFIALNRGLIDEAIAHLQGAARAPADLGLHFTRYGFSASMQLAVTPQLMTMVEPNLRGVLLGLVEAYQLRGMHKDAVECLRFLLAQEPEDFVVALSLAELTIDGYGEHQQACNDVLSLTEGIANLSPFHAAILLYRGKAFAGVGRYSAAIETFTAALDPFEDRPRDLLYTIHYARALAYEQLGHNSEARADLEIIFHGAPDFEDVVQRLGRP